MRKLSALKRQASVSRNAAARTGILKTPYPWNSLLFKPGARFLDITIFEPHFREFGNGLRFFNATRSPFAYPPAASLVFVPIFATGHALIVFPIVVLAAIAAFGAMICWRGRRVSEFPLLVAAVVMTAVTSYPYMIDRANIEGVLWILSAGGLALFIGKKYTTASVLFGLGTAMKFNPGALLLLLVARRQWRGIAIAVGVVLGTTLLALALLGPSIPIACENIQAGLAFFKDSYSQRYRWEEIGWDHSLFSVIKQFIGIFRGISMAQSGPGILKAYHIYSIAVPIAVGGLYLLRVRKLPVLNVLLFATAAMTLFPYVSYEYTLANLYLPWALLVLSLLASTGWRQTISARTAIWLLMGFAVLFSPLVVSAGRRHRLWGPDQGSCVIGSVLCERRHSASLDVVRRTPSPRGVS